MPLDLDFLTQIVNVNWEGGLAVEFTKRPDYLTMNHALSMNKVAISVWFRVPTEAAEAVRAGENIFWEYRVFQNVVPLITWGSQKTTEVTGVEIYDTGAINVSAQPIMLERISGSHTAPLQPSTIGVRVGSAATPEHLLDVHIQTDVHAMGTGLLSIQTAFTGDFAGIDIHSGKPIYANIEYTTEDVSYAVTEEPEYLGNSDSNTSSSGAGHPEVMLDKWHHLLISWELISHSNTSGASKMWCAIDDENKTRGDLPAMNDNFAMGPNDQMSGMPFQYQTDDTKAVSVSFGSDDVPSDPFQIPAPPSVKRASDDSGSNISIAPIAKVELAELQIFSGVTLDTSILSNRRAFIDFKRDADGKPIKDENGKMSLEPVDPKKAEELMGKRPEILLHGTSDWKEGKNTGSLGLTSADPPAEILSGQFKPTGTIEKYTPDPSIEK